MKKSFLFVLLTISAINSVYSFGQILEPREGANNKWGFVDETGELIIPFKYDLVDGFAEGLAAVSIREAGWGFIDKNDSVVIPLKYDLVFHFVEGITQATLNGKTGFIDRTGKVVIPFKYDHAVNFSESPFKGFSLVRLDGKYGFINKAGTEVVPIRYDVNGASRRLMRTREWRNQD